jgi:hypothetical protein
MTASPSAPSKLVSRVSWAFASGLSPAAVERRRYHTVAASASKTTVAAFARAHLPFDCRRRNAHYFCSLFDGKAAEEPILTMTLVAYFIHLATCLKESLRVLGLRGLERDRVGAGSLNTGCNEGRSNK